MRHYAIALFLSVLAFALPFASATADMIEERVSKFKKSGSEIQAVFRKHLPNNDLATIAAAADYMAAWAGDIPAAFPRGSKSEGARADIWDDFSDFTDKANANRKAAQKLAAAARSGDSDATMAAARALGGTCKSCHEKYRIKKD